MGGWTIPCLRTALYAPHEAAENGDTAAVERLENAYLAQLADERR